MRTNFGKNHDLGRSFATVPPANGPGRNRTTTNRSPRMNGSRLAPSRGGLPTSDSAQHGEAIVSPQRETSAEPTARDDTTVFVVDDDSDIRASLKQLFEAVNLRVELFESAEEFLRAERTESPGCLLLDVRMPGIGGLQLLTHLQSLKEHPPVIMLTGHGDIPMVLQSLQSGALDFIEKPATHQRLLASVNKALAVVRDRRALEREKRRVHALFGTLSAREREVLELMVGGSCSKAIALELGISLRTLEKHREHIMRKTGARSVSELIRAVLQHGCA